MNKKVLSAILFSALFAGTGTFTSCIDNDEPAGIEELRGAKAELLRAKVAVEQAQAALVMAKAETEKALAAKTNAEAEIAKAVAAINQAKADSINVKTEEERENLKQLIAKNELELDSLQLKHQLIMTNLKTQLANSQATYESTLAQIAVIKEMYPLGTEQGWTLYSLETAVKTWTKKVAKADSIVKERQADYDTALIYKQYYGGIETGELEATVDTAEIQLAAAKAELADMEAWLEEDALTKDWRAEVDKLNTKLDSLNKLQASLNAQKTLAENSEEYKALVTAYTEAQKSANVDSAYSYTYVEVDATEKALKESTLRLYATKDPVTGEVGNTVLDKNFATTQYADSLAAKVELSAINAIATYTNGALTGGQLYTDKKYLASFTTEAKALLDTIAAGAKVDTSYVDDIKAWKDTLALYNGLDADAATTIAALKTKAQGALTKYLKSPKEISAKNLSDSLTAYYTAAEKNGLELGTVPYKKWTVDGTGKTTASYDLESMKTVAADTAKVAFVVDSVYKAVAPFFAVGQTADTFKGKAYKKDGVLTAQVLDAEALKERVIALSKAAFGKASLYLQINTQQSSVTVTGLGYLHTQPTEADVKGLKEYYNINGISQLGSYGKYLFTTDAVNIVYAKNYKTIMANLEGAIAYWEAKYAILKAKYDAQVAAKDAALLAKNKYYYENISALTRKVTEITEETTEIGLITDALDDLINVYLPAWENKSQLGDYSAPADAFKKNLNNIIALKQASVRGIERKLAAAKVALELSGTKYISELAIAESNLNKAIEDLKDAQAELDKALADVAKALEIIAALDAE